VSIAFGVGAAVLSAALATVTFVLVDHYLVGQQVQNATHETYADARLARRDLLQGGPNIGEVLSSFTEPEGSAAYLYQDGVWYSGALAFGYGPGNSRPLGVPNALVTTVTAGQPARQVVVVAGQPAVTIGVPLPAVGAAFFEVYSLAELSHTLDVLAWVLTACAAATALAGAVLGRWASGRLVRPIRHVASTAAAIAQGGLGERLPPGAGPELELLSRSFNDMVRALQERIERDAQFASNVSHELRSPLTTIQAGVDFLQSASAQLSPDARHALELLSAEVGRFSAMVQDLLEMSRFDAGVAQLDLEDLDIGELVTGTVSAYTGGSVAVVVAPPAQGLVVSGDRRRLQRVLVNLLDNARAHAGGAVAVRVNSPKPGCVELSVEDAGPGVAPAERSAVFERFYRGAAAGRRGEGTAGTGLGLSLVAQHVKAHGGSVEVADRPGGGARFVVRLPVDSGGAQVSARALGGDK
jgi:two-component system sensor histidine kinase MtrB